VNTDRPQEIQRWSETLKREWEERSASPARDFFVASSPGWNDPEAWAAQARSDVDLILTNLSPEDLTDFHALEIGCGVGRLVPELAPRVKSYTGFDISRGMVEEARARCGGLRNARFFEGPGAQVPEEARDRSYNRVLAVAVFIHCPKEVIASYIENAYSLLAPGGQIRFQVLADQNDPAGLNAASEYGALEEESQETDPAVPEGALDLIDGHYFYGHFFRFDELETLCLTATSGEAQVHRLSPLHFWAIIAKP